MISSVRCSCSLLRTAPAAAPQSAGLHRFALEKAAVAGRFTQIQQLRLERVVPVDEVGELQVLQLLIGVRAVRLDQEHVAAVDRAAPSSVM